MAAAEKDKPVDGKLVSYVHVLDDRGVASAFGPDDAVPAWAARKMGFHCWEGDVHPMGKDAPSEPPPKSGPGSSVQAWSEYASAQGVTVDDAATREQIVNALDARQVRTE